MYTQGGARRAQLNHCRWTVLPRTHRVLLRHLHYESATDSVYSARARIIIIYCDNAVSGSRISDNCGPVTYGSGRQNDVARYIITRTRSGRPRVCPQSRALSAHLTANPTYHPRFAIAANPAFEHVHKICPQSVAGFPGCRASADIVRYRDDAATTL